MLCRVPVDVVYIAGNVQKHGQEMQAAIKLCERFGIPFALPAHPFRLDRARPEHSHAVADGYLHYVSQRREAAPDGHQAPVRHRRRRPRRLWCCCRCFAVVACIIKLTSRGPVFFKQQRVGLHGKPFNMLKFRSMVVNAEELQGQARGAERADRPGLQDEERPAHHRASAASSASTPSTSCRSCINVLRGEMSVVGPRPPVPTEVAKYEAWQRRRLSVRPGLTCIWQVSGRNQISFEEWMYLDMQYIDNWTLLTDLGLILKTVPVVITGRGAS